MFSQINDAMVCWVAVIMLLLPLTSDAAPAKRIIALSPHSVELLYAIGAGDTIIATTEYADYPIEAQKIPRIGGYYGIQMEQVLALDPDLIVVWESGNRVDDIAQLNALGFKLYHSQPTTLASVANELEALGKLTGHIEQANKVAANFRINLSQLRTANRNKPPIKVFYQLWSTPLMTVSKNSWVQQIIDVCQGENVFENVASDYPQISMESILLRQPEVIVTQDNSKTTAVDWAQWPEIPAVKKQHIYQLDADLLNRASPRVLAGAQALCDALDRAR